jgi:hypothetical protein
MRLGIERSLPCSTREENLRPTLTSRGWGIRFSQRVGPGQPPGRSKDRPLHASCLQVARDIRRLRNSCCPLRIFTRASCSEKPFRAIYLRRENPHPLKNKGCGTQARREIPHYADSVRNDESVSGDQADLKIGHYTKRTLTHPDKPRVGHPDFLDASAGPPALSEDQIRERWEGNFPSLRAGRTTSQTDE